MFDFAYPLHLYLLGLVVLFALLYMWARASRLRKIKRFGRPDIVARLMPDASRYQPRIKIVLELLALIALVIVIARPRAGPERTGDKRQKAIRDHDRIRHLKTLMLGVFDRRP